MSLGGGMHFLVNCRVHANSWSSTTTLSPVASHRPIDKSRLKSSDYFYVLYNWYYYRRLKKSLKLLNLPYQPACLQGCMPCQPPKPSRRPHAPSTNPYPVYCALYTHRLHYVLCYTLYCIRYFVLYYILYSTILPILYTVLCCTLLHCNVLFYTVVH